MVAALESKLKKVIGEHEETKKLVEKTRDELTQVKKESHKRKKMIIAQQQIIQAGTDSYNKVRAEVIQYQGHYVGTRHGVSSFMSVPFDQFPY